MFETILNKFLLNMAFKKFILIQQTENPRHSSDALPRSLRRQWTQELTTLPRLWQCQPLRRTAPMPHLQPRLAQTVDKQDTAPLHLDKLRSLPPIIMLHKKTSHLPGLAATAAVLIPLHWMPWGPQEPGVGNCLDKGFSQVSVILLIPAQVSGHTDG